MDQHCLTDALVLSKRVGNLLFETYGISEELGQALDRNDQVTVQMLLAMRSEPIEKLKTADTALRELRDSIADPEDREHLSELLKGESPSNEKERLLVDQCESNARQLQKVLELDQRLNRRITRDKSIYHQKH
jgi:GTP cyclohydrolase III